MGNTSRPLWCCPQCGREFANTNQTHSCGRHSLEAHFEGRSPEVRAIFDAIVRMLETIGPVRVLPEKTRIAFQVRMSFAQVTPRRSWVDGHVVLARRLAHPRFRTIQSISPRTHVHTFRLAKADEVDAEVDAWFREAYEVGAQRHLHRKTET
jgi:hypothetical protein